MNIYTIRDILRQWFSQKGIPECPEFPAALSDGWHHPDVLLAMFRKKNDTFCIFQTLSEHSFCNIGPLKNSPGLIWLVKPFSPQFPDILFDFLNDLQSKLYAENTEQRFSISALATASGDFQDRSCTYQILFNGLVCGECRIFSEMLEEKLRTPVALITIDVGRLMRFVIPRDIEEDPDWLDSRKLKQYAAFHAFQGPKYEANRTSEFLLHEIYRLVKNQDSGEFEKLNSLINLYNSSRGTFAESLKLRKSFCNAIKKIIDSFNHSNEEGKPAKKT
ncbi:MAG: hypothetical protein Kow0029_10460 [Candidatus Rifleibacteriota bacterium]